MQAKTGAKDFFMWAGAMLFLYASIVAFIALLFSYINYVFPDALNNYSINPYDSGVSYWMAMLIVLVPLFLVLMRFIRRDIEKDASRAELWVRRWALYLTLFVAGVTVAGDLITLLYFFLSGQDLTVRFLLKVVVVLLVASAGFMHFLADIKGYWVANPKKARLIGYAAGLLVVLSIAAGFFIIGTPWDAQKYRLDQNKVNDLQNIQGQVVSYWELKQKLPASLADLNNPLGYFIVPVDGQTGAAYEYSVTGATSFSVCATFNSASDERSQAVTRPAYPTEKGIADNWSHASGRVCFARTIDPELYPPINPVKK